MLPTPTKGQLEALSIFRTWYEKKQYKKQQILRIGGAAGVGKGVLIQYIMDLYKFDIRSCWVVAYTGQAVNVLRQRGIQAKTIHSSFMAAKEVPLYDEYGRPITRDGIPLLQPSSSH